MHLESFDLWIEFSPEAQCAEGATGSVVIQLLVVHSEPQGILGRCLENTEMEGEACGYRSAQWISQITYKDQKKYVPKIGRTNFHQVKLWNTENMKPVSAYLTRNK